MKKPNKTRGPPHLDSFSLYMLGRSPVKVGGSFRITKNRFHIMQENNVFKTLNAVNCNEHTEKKGNLTYLSWAWAWQIVKTHFPDAFYTVYENPEGWNYFTDGRTCWVKTGVTIQGLEHIEHLPVMDQRNQSIPFESVRSTDVNRAIQRSLTKACARHGLGLYIYAGEDIPDSQQTPATQQQTPQTQQPQRRTWSRSYYSQTNKS